MGWRDGPATEPAPRFDGMRELQHARRLLAQGLELDRTAQAKIVKFAIDLAARSEVRHDEACGVWRGSTCNCPETPREYEHR